MRAIGRRLLVLGLAFVAAACVPKPQPKPEPAPPAPVARPAPTPPAPAVVRNWADLPLTPGSWSYGSDAGASRAIFAGPSGAVHFSIECQRANRRVLLIREGAASGTIALRTSYGTRTLPAVAQPAPRTALAATLAASDPLLDQIAFSRGRFTVEAASAPQLVLPAWPETARVTEDCRV